MKKPSEINTTDSPIPYDSILRIIAGNTGTKKCILLYKFKKRKMNSDVQWQTIRTLIPYFSQSFSGTNQQKLPITST